MEEIILTAKELFYLGKYMRAKYIDYAYIAAMPDIQKRYSLHEEQALEALEDKGVLEEDFSGNIEFADGMKELFAPVFFGDTESLLDNGVEHRVHILGGSMTLGKLEEGEIAFSPLSEEELGKLLTGDVRIQCAKAGKGAWERSFTGRQLGEPALREEAMKLLKGEVEYGIS